MVISPTLESTKYRHPAEIPINQWVSQLWNHRLMDNFTREHRRKAEGNYQAMMGWAESSSYSYRLDVNRFMAARIGGGDLWFAGPDSDHDIVLYSDNRQMGYEFMDKYNPMIDFIREQFGIDLVVGVQPITNQDDAYNLITSGLALPLLITPDELILGNKKIAQQGRLAIVEELEDMSLPVRNDCWNGETPESFGNFFRMFYRDWFYHADSYYDKIGRNTEYDKKKQFEGRLIDWAQQRDYPDRALELFLSDLSKFELPDFEEYCEVIKENGGKLSMF